MEAPRHLSRSRRHRGARRLARGLCLGALTAALLGATAVPAGAAVGPGVEFIGPGAAAGFVEPAEARYEGERVSGPCALRSRPGETPQSITCGGLPAGDALRSAGVGSFGYITVPRPNGTTAYLSASEVEGPGAVYEGEVPPIFSVGGPKTLFYRPIKKEDPADVNAEDFIATVSGEKLVVGVHGGNVLKVSVDPSSTTAAPGAPVSFSASASGGKPGEAITFDWSFGDGTTATTKEGEPVTHAFAGTGTYDVRVTAIGSEESGGESGPTAIVVGNPPTTAQPGATTAPATAPRSPTPTGPQGTGGDGRGGRGAKPGPGGKSKKNADPSPTPHPASPAKHQANDSPSKSTRPASPSSPEPKPAVPAFEVPAAEPAPPIEEPSGGDSAEPPRCCSDESPPEGSPHQTPPRQEPSPVTASGDLVEGRLVGDDLGPVPSAEAPSPSAAGQGSRSAAGAVGAGGPGVPVVALIAVALLAAGALFEWRRLPRAH